MNMDERPFEATKVEDAGSGRAEPAAASIAAARAETPRRRLWRWLRGFERGTLAQWVGVMATWVMLGLAVYGLDRALLIIENENLRSEQQALRQAVADERAAVWRYVCSQFVRKANGTSFVSAFSAAAAPGEPDGHDPRTDALIALKAVGETPPSSGVDLLRSELSRGDLPLLSADRRQQFEALIEGFIAEHRGQLETPLLVPVVPRESDALRAWYQRADQTWQQYDIALAQLLDRCNAASDH
jgi:hypothetical protein